MSDLSIDARHLLCPLPVLRAQKALRDMQSGARLVITGNDPSSLREFEIFQTQQQDFTIKDTRLSEDGWRLTLVKA